MKQYLYLVTCVLSLPVIALAGPSTSVAFHNNNAIAFVGKIDSQAGTDVKTCVTNGWCAHTSKLSQMGSPFEVIQTYSSTPFPNQFSAYVQAINGASGKLYGPIVPCTAAGIKPGVHYLVEVTSPGGNDLVCSVKPLTTTG